MNEEPVWTFELKNMEQVLGALAKANEFLKQVPILELCEAYKKLFPETDESGRYFLSKEMLNKLSAHFVSKAAMELVNLGMLEMYVMDDGEIGFKLTQMGYDMAQKKPL